MLFFSFIPPKIFVVWVEFTWHLNIWRMPQRSWLLLLLVAWVENHYQITLIEIIISYWSQMCCYCLNSVSDRGEIWMLLSNTGMQWWKRLSNCKVLSILTISFFNVLFFQATVCLNTWWCRKSDVLVPLSMWICFVCLTSLLFLSLPSPLSPFFITSGYSQMPSWGFDYFTSNLSWSWAHSVQLLSVWQH